MSIDELIFRALWNLRSPGLDRVMVDISALGSTALVTIQAFIAGVFLILVLHSRRAALHLGVATGGCAVWIEVLKWIFGRARPETIPHLVEVTGLSFPSGHAAESMALYATLVLILSPHLNPKARIAARVIATVLVALVAVSRVYLGVHYASDVAGGLLLGIVWTWAASRLVPPNPPR